MGPVLKAKEAHDGIVIERQSCGPYVLRIGCQIESPGHDAGLQLRRPVAAIPEPPQNGLQIA